MFHRCVDAQSKGGQNGTERGLATRAKKLNDSIQQREASRELLISLAHKATGLRDLEKRRFEFGADVSEHVESRSEDLGALGAEVGVLDEKLDAKFSDAEKQLARGDANDSVYAKLESFVKGSVKKAFEDALAIFAAHMCDTV